ncbi:MAG: IS91 family transposase [Magnetococcales bacterium]|nr:IS91 family transposase [Magnetococcales bacterium]MBF0116471.1 IS91 family transposase [Magnetococcales bacterium]
MIEIADIFRKFGDTYLAAFGDSMLPSHKQAINAIINCRTEAMGGHLYQCDSCHQEIYSYHSCKNRSCPKCHTEQTNRWLELRKDEMLPIPYFHVTITVPEILRPLFQANQNDAYRIFMKACADSILELAKDPRYVNGMVGILMVLHTWTQQMLHHPHSHCLVTGGGITDDGSWNPANEGFLFPLKALSKLVRGKFLTRLKQLRPDINIPESAWQQNWVSHCTVWGKGEQAVLDYLARYVFRIAINKNRILAMDDQTVTFRYQERKKRRWRTCRVSGMEFMRRFLMHVLPKGFHKVRYFGIWNQKNRQALRQVSLLFILSAPPIADLALTQTADQPPTTKVAPGSHCPHCTSGTILLVRRIPSPAIRPP